MKKTKLSILFSLIVIMGACSVSNAQPSFPPCIDYRGLQVQIAKTRSTAEGPAFSTWDSTGRPLIVFNERIMDTIAHSEPMVMFVYEHECGHHALGHINGTASDASRHLQLQKELDADCYAAKELKQMNYSVHEISEVIDDVYPWPRDPEHPSGRVRSKHLLACYEGRAN